MSNSTKDAVVNSSYCEWTSENVFSTCTAFFLFFFFFSVIEIQDLGFDSDFCFTFLCLVAIFSQESLDCIRSDTCLFNSSWKRGNGTSETGGSRKMYDCWERGKRISFSPHEKKN